MAMSLGGHRHRRMVAEINVTPLVDVMLVLLVVFMITAPTLHDGFKVELPVADAGKPIPIEGARVIVVASDGTVLHEGATQIQDAYVHLAELVQDLRLWKERQASDVQAVVVISADREVRYERIIQVWNAVVTAGITRVSFRIDQPMMSADP
jgi:biopolymer transport protein TolR